jgi:hypothetical protein
MNKLKLSRVFLLISAALFVIGAIGVMVAVIPAVRADTFPGSTPDAAVPAFWVGSLLSLLLAAILGVIAVRTRGRTRGLTAVLVVLILFLFFISFAFQDAFRAYAVDGPAMQTTAGLLRLFSNMDYLGVLLVIIATYLLPKKV